MPTDIAVVLARRAEEKAKAAKDEMAELAVVFLWYLVGLTLMELICRHGLDLKTATSLISGG